MAIGRLGGKEETAFVTILGLAFLKGGKGFEIPF